MKHTARILFGLIILSSCNVSHYTLSDAANWIPTNFNPQSGILLVEHFPLSKRSDQKMQEYLDQNYPGRYEIMDRETIMNTKQANMQILKYISLHFYGRISTRLKYR